MTKRRLLFTHEQIQEAIQRLATNIRSDYQSKRPLLIGILKGSFIFMADLVRALEIPLEIDFVKLSSYGIGIETSGMVRTVQGLTAKVRDRDVLVVEDIVDTGLTLSFLLEELQKEQPASLKVCALLDKPSRRKVPVTIDYLGLTIDDVFVVGYGIDFAEDYRYLPEIWGLEEKDES